ncbi:HAF repeat-containing protein [Frankia alni]|uniref:HAF repeat-containing protein n=2 Tax=Frankia TaxID=1854 RepID=UPI0002D4849C|nr:HAF repeat-containing protein [Frankia alni]
MGAVRAIRVAAAATVMAAATVTGAVLSSGVAVAAAPAAGPVRPVDLGALPGITHNGATSINNRGDVVGSGYSSPYDSHGFRWSRGVLTALPDTARAPLLINDAGQIAGVLPGRFTSSGFVIRPDGAVVDPGFTPVDQNERGQVVGTGPAGGGTHAMSWRDGRTVDLGAPAGYTSQAIAVSDNGWILGELQRKDHPDDQFARWLRGRWVPLPGPHGRAVDINDRGDVVGWATTPAGITHATLWQRDRAIDLGPEDAALSQALAVNNGGQIVGSTFDPDTDAGHVLLWDHGRQSDLGTFGGSFARPLALNDRGDVVVQTSTGAFRWRHGRTVRLDGSAEPAAINNLGQVVGSVLRPDGTSHAALWN